MPFIPFPKLPRSEWVLIEIICVGKQVTVYINGKT